MLLLCCLIALPVSGMAGAPNTFYDLGLDAAIKDTPYATWGTSGVTVYYDGSAGVAFAILHNHEQRLLFELTKASGAWRIAQTYQRPVCQGTHEHMDVCGDGDGYEQRGGNLLLYHWADGFAMEEYTFIRQDGQWVFDHAYVRIPLDDPSSASGIEFFRVCFVRWQDGMLVYSGYVEDLYDKLPAAQRIAEPGRGYWSPTEAPRAPEPCPQPIPLDAFDIETFPWDPFTIAYLNGADSECAWKLGQRDPNSTAIYAVVNNPNPKNRLNLRAEPSTAANYLGKYYNGMEFRVLEELPGGWVRVTAGMNNLSGYMRREFLAFGDEGLAVKNVMPRFTSTAQSWPLYYLPFDESNVKATLGPGIEIEVMGVVNGWWHIRVEGEGGYVREWVSLD